LAWEKAVTPATLVIVGRRSRRDSDATRFSENITATAMTHAH
jgi:hypothetical protein